MVCRLIVDEEFNRCVNSVVAGQSNAPVDTVRDWRTHVFLVFFCNLSASPLLIHEYLHFRYVVTPVSLPGVRHWAGGHGLCPLPRRGQGGSHPGPAPADLWPAGRGRARAGHVERLLPLWPAGQGGDPGHLPATGWWACLWAWGLGGRGEGGNVMMQQENGMDSSPAAVEFAELNWGWFLSWPITKRLSTVWKFMSSIKGHAILPNSTFTLLLLITALRSPLCDPSVGTLWWLLQWHPIRTKSVCDHWSQCVCSHLWGRVAVARTCRADGANALIGAARKCVGSERARAFGLGVNWGSEMQ